MIKFKGELNNWENDWFNERENVDVLLIQAYQAGADAELEACCAWTTANFGELPSQNLYLFRRPKPSSLKKQALKTLEEEIARKPLV